MPIKFLHSLSVDDSVLYIDGENNRVGIGTTSPDRTLDVNGSVDIDGTLYINANHNHIRLIDADSTGSFSVGVNTNFQIRDVTAATTPFSIEQNAPGNCILIDSSGNVGVGLSNPTAKLHVDTGVDDGVNTVIISHTRNNSDVGTKALKIDMNLSGADTTSGDRTNAGIHIDLDSSADGDASDEHRIYGIWSDVRHTGFSDLVRGGYFYAENNNITEKVAQLVGAYGHAVHDTDSANGGVTRMYGVYGTSGIQDDGDVDNAYGGYFSTTIGTNRDTNVDNTFGVEAEIAIDKDTEITFGSMIGVSSVIDNNEDSTPVGSNTYLFKGDYQGTRFATNAWGIYVEGDKHYLEGNVGINETNPNTKLHVTTTSIVPATFEASTPGHLIDLVTTNSSPTYNGIRFYHGNTQKMSVSHIADGTTSGYVQIGNNWAAGSEILVVDGRTSRVGIGTNSPDNLLEIQTESGSGVTGNDGIFVKTPQPGVAPVIGYKQPFISIGTSDDPGATSTIYLGEDATATNQETKIEYDRDSDTLGIFAKGQGTYREHVRFGNPSSPDPRTYFSGNVGIGVTSPSQKIHVAGSARFEAGASGLGAFVSVGNTTETAGNYSAYYFGNTANDTGYFKGGIAYETLSSTFGRGDMHFLQDSGANSSNATLADSVMTILNGGNVGIGTTSPDVKLDVHSSNVAAFFESSANSVPVSIIHTSSSISSIGFKGSTTTNEYRVRVGANGNDFIAYTSNTERLRILDNGNVGIGLTNPGVKLDVNGRFRVQDNGDIVLDANPTTGGFSIGDTAEVGGGAYIAGDNTDISIVADGGPIVTFKGGGNVGIGTTSPSEKLTIDGYARASYGNYLGYKNADVFDYIDSNTVHYWLKVGNIDSSNNSTKLSLEINTFGDNNYPRNTRFTVVAQKYGTGVSLSCFKNYGSSYSDILYVKLDSNLDLWVKRTISWDHRFLVKPIVIDGGAVFNYDYTGDNRTSTEPSGGTPIIQNDRAIRVATTDLSTVTHEYSNMYFRIDGDPKLTILNTGNIGIGTTSPGAKLEVNGDIISSGKIQLGSSADSDFFTGDSRMSVDGYIMTKAIVNTSETGSAPAAIVFGDGATFSNDRISLITNGQRRLYVHLNGNITIQENLTVEGDISAANLGTASASAATDFVAVTGDTMTGSLTINGNSTYALAVDGAISTDQYIAFLADGVNSSPDMTIGVTSNVMTFSDVSGGGKAIFNVDNVGIGTTSPAEKLEVESGNILVDNGQIIIDRDTPGAALSWRESDSSTTAGQLRSYANRGDIYLYSNGAKLTEISTGDSFFNGGNVGIGTESPDAPLRIDQDSNAVALKVTGGGGGTSIAEFVRDVGADTSVRIHGSSAHSTIQIASANNTFSLGVNNTTFQICDNDTLTANARLSIDNSGNVGIGTTSPSKKLHVNGDTQVDNGGLLLGGTSSINGDNPQLRRANSSNDLRIATAGSDRMTILGTGNVGIGTTSPSQKLDVNGNIISTSGTGNFIRSQHSGDRYAQLESNSSGGVVKGIGGNGFLIRSYGDTYFNGGNIGIGTTSPSQKLDVVGSIEVSDGVYIGGTAAANKLDDYEEGTYTPSITATGTDTSGFTSNGYYTKIGDIVHVEMRITKFVDEDESSKITNITLPFAANNTSTIYYKGGLWHSETYDKSNLYTLLRESTTNLTPYNGATNGLSLSADENNTIGVNITYKAQ